MRIVVSGATGFLGGQVARHLAGAHEVIGLGRDAAGLEALRRAGIVALRVELTEPVGDAVRAIGGADAFVHCAALSAPWGPMQAFRAANVDGTARALDMAEALGVRRFVNISSPSIYFAPRDQEGVREDHPLPRPVNAYAATKVEAERLVLARVAVGPVSLRPRGIYGAGDTALVPRLLAAVDRGPLPLLRGGRGAIDLTHVSDVVRAVEAALWAVKAVGESFNISGGEMLPVRQIVEACCAATGCRVRWRAMPLAPLMAVARLVGAVRGGGPEPRITPYALGLFAFRQSLDLSKAARVLGWKPDVRFDEGLDRTFAGGVQ